MLTNSDNQQTQYALKVNGAIIGKWPQKILADNALVALPLETQPLAEVVPVDSAGRELLFG